MIGEPATVNMKIIMAQTQGLQETGEIRNCDVGGAFEAIKPRAETHGIANTQRLVRAERR